MERPQHSQLELFSQAGEHAADRAQKERTSFFIHVKNYEKILLSVIGALVIGIISFSMGVERGKRLAFLTPAAKIKAYSSSGSKSEKLTGEKPDGRQPAERREIIKEPVLKDFQENFAIQLASYQTENPARKEAELLKKKGFDPLVLSKGKYTVLYVGKFASKEKAKIALSELKKRYKDCFIRRM